MFKKVLFPVDIDQDSSLAALPDAGDIARRFDGNLTLLNVQAPMPSMVSAYLPDDYPQESVQMIKDRLKSVIDENKLGAGTEVVVRHGSPHHAILEYAEAEDIDLIIIASHNPGLVDYLLGSTAGQVVRHAQCSVLVLRSGSSEAS
ncbi:hypothetical protein MNBD_ALPHA09-722 [hydrothermal vent metagenome]|uniref:UspA domain-containing protein n=1 Tax=hydrothermal vent metagenome TaxID=652676 RepID=A0A3B0TAF5_9ZZZZ